MGSKKKVAWNCSSSDNWSLKRKTQTFRRNVVEHMNSLLVVDTSADFPLEFSTKTFVPLYLHIVQLIQVTVDYK